METPLKEPSATETLIRATDGSAVDAEQLFRLLYGELRQMAEREMRRERAEHTLQPSELVHEVFFRLVDRDRCRVKDRMQFLGLACRAMRQVLVDHARRRNVLKRGGDWTRVPLDDLHVPGRRDYDTTLLALDEALNRLMARHPDKARLVDMH